MSDDWFYIEGLNPLPWTASQASTGRVHGELRTTFYKSEALKAYQAAVKEEMEIRYPAVEPYPEGSAVWLRFWFVRELDMGEVVSSRRRAHQADVTNLQKALEDSLQKILFVNDRDVRVVHSVMVEQAPNITPIILIQRRLLNERAISSAGHALIAHHRVAPSHAVLSKPVPNDDLF